MRLLVGPVPDDPEFHPQQGGWRKLKTPSFRLLMLISLPLSVLTATGVLFVWAAVAGAHGIDTDVPVVVTPRTLLVSVAALAALVLVHELLHAAVLPRCGFTSGTIVGFWPAKFAPYVAYQGELARYRFVVSGLMPLLILSGLPILVGVLFGWMPWWVVLLSAVNAFMSSGDLINTVVLLSQTPASAIVRNKCLETWWRLPES
jgi:hypothetical protein